MTFSKYLALILQSPVFLNFEDKRIRLYAKLGCYIQDGAAHREVWGIKGDKGTKMCMCCDIVDGVSELTTFDPNVKSNVIKASELHYNTDIEIIDTAKRLEAFRLVDSPEAFKQRQQIMGITYKPYSLLTDRLLEGIIKPATQFMHDWIHGLFANWYIQHIVVLFAERFGGPCAKHL